MRQLIESGDKMTDDRRKSKWEKTRQAGKGKYIALYGLLGFGGVFVLVSLLFQAFREDSITFDYVVQRIVIGLIAGALYGWVSWRSNEKRYHDLT
ncbi:hypothetical protein [Thalassobacillus cyri]|nr:hypothetical protein [Thalassobacillus cyri]